MISTKSYYSVGEHRCDAFISRCLFGCFPLNLELRELFFKSLHLHDGVGTDLVLPMFFDKDHDEFE